MFVNIVGMSPIFIVGKSSLGQVAHLDVVVSAF
jgi:hypothetical protein